MFEHVSLKAILAQLSTVGLWVLLTAMAWKITPRWGDFAFTFVVGLTGVALGWLIGLLASPYSTEEEQRFTALTKAIGVFFSGYAVAKLDPLVVWLTSPERLAANHLLLARILIFVAALATAVINMYVFRIYIDPNEAGVRGPAPDGSVSLRTPPGTAPRENPHA